MTVIRIEGIPIVAARLAEASKAKSPSVRKKSRGALKMPAHDKPVAASPQTQAKVA